MDIFSNGQLDVFRIVVLPSNDEHVLVASTHKELAGFSVDKTEISRPQEFEMGVGGSGIDIGKSPFECRASLVCFVE